MCHAWGLDDLEIPYWKSNPASHSCNTVVQNKDQVRSAKLLGPFSLRRRIIFALFGGVCFLNAFVSSVRNRHSRYWRCQCCQPHIANGRRPSAVSCHVILTRVLLFP